MTDSVRSAIRLVGKLLGVLLLLAVLVPFVVYAVPQVVGADHGMVVLSGSMEPTMSPGDAVIVTEVPPERIETGDIITFQRQGSQTPTTHRVIEIDQTENGPAYVTKGDANEDPDAGAVPAGRVIGEVMLVIPWIGYFVQFTNTQLGFLALVLAPFGLLLVSELWNLARATGDNSGAETATDDVEPTPTDAAPTTDDSDEFTLTTSGLQLGIGLLLVYAPYSGYVAYTLREAWAVAVATATGIALLFALMLYGRIRGSEQQLVLTDGTSAGGDDA